MSGRLIQRPSGPSQPFHHAGTTVKIGFIADIHEDAPALRDALCVLEQRGCDTVCCLGDIVGFSARHQREPSRRDAESCVALVRETCTTTVAGNHDLFAVRRIPAHAAEFPYGPDWYALDEKTRRRRARGRLWQYEDDDLPHRLSDDALAYLHALPEHAMLDVGGFRIMLSHYRFPDLTGSLAASLHDNHLERHIAFIRSHGCLLSFSGHGHPEGIAHTAHGHLTFTGFGTFPVHRHTQWIVAPGVARGDRASGVLTFDTRSVALEAIALHVP